MSLLISILLLFSFIYLLYKKRSKDSITGNHLPDIAIKNLYRILCEFDPNVEIIDGEYWEQNYLEVGVFVIDKDGFRFVSTSIDDVDIDEENAFETYVYPVLNKLKNDL